MYCLVRYFQQHFIRLFSILKDAKKDDNTYSVVSGNITCIIVGGALFYAVLLGRFHTNRKV